jgi:hypothetical protein
MPAAKKSASAKAAPKKKTAPKKTAAKKAAPKKTAPPKKPEAPKVVAAPAFKSKYIDFSANTGEYTLRFDDKQAFEKALAIIKGAPANSGGQRNPPRYSVSTDGLPCWFVSVKSYVVRDA